MDNPKTKLHSHKNLICDKESIRNQYRIKKMIGENDSADGAGKI